MLRQTVQSQSTAGKMSNVLACRPPRPDAKIRLYCFPWAGGGANFYANWSKHLSDTIEVYGVCLRGRESRHNDPVYENLPQLLDDVTKAIFQTCQGKPFAFWGHSMGALLAYEAAGLMKTRHSLEPVYMFLSGVSAPHSEKRKQKTLDIKNYTDDEFVNLLRHFGGTPKEILDNTELMRIYLPPLRADYEILPQISHDPPDQRSYVFSCPLDVFDGDEDDKHDLESWKDITSGPFSITMLNGGHFYLKEDTNTRKLCFYVQQALNGCAV